MHILGFSVNLPVNTKAQEALAPLAESASKYDTDGIDICFLNNKKVATNLKVRAVEFVFALSAYCFIRVLHKSCNCLKM
jgi:hypothetical protein